MANSALSERVKPVFSRSTVVTASDFFEGLLAAAKLRGIETLSVWDDKFDQSVSEAFLRLQEIASSRGYSLPFRIRTNPTHGDSAGVKNAIAKAVYKGYASLDNPRFITLRIKLTESESETLLEKKPLDKNDYNELLNIVLKGIGR